MFTHFLFKDNYLANKKIFISILISLNFLTNICFADDLPIQNSVRQIKSGRTHTCAVTTDNKLYCWGKNDHGKIGSGSDDEVETLPVEVLQDVSSVNLKSDNTCAIKTTGGLYCWGSNAYGQVGNGGASASASTPVEVLDNVISVGMGDMHVCALKSNNELYCWGFNGLGQVGIGSSVESQSVPVKVLEDVSSVSSGSYHTCAIKTNGKLYCWGINFSAQVGSGSNNDYEYTPVEILQDVTSVSLGSGHSCALKVNGKLYCWGYNGYGQVGSGNNNEYVSTPVEILEDVIGVSLGGGHTCALKSDGKLYCWGFNQYGQIGNGSSGDYVYEPTEILEDVTNISLGGLYGGGFTCARKSDGKLYCWGVNSAGQVGSENATVLTPTEVLEDVARVGTGEEYTCATQTNGKLLCWGTNPSGQVVIGQKLEFFNGSGTLPEFNNDCSRHWYYLNVGTPCETANENICNKQGEYKCFNAGDSESIACAPSSCCEDELYSLIGNTCSNGQGGACSQEGQYFCNGDFPNSTVECSAEAGNPLNELCNGLDDDCDGEIDEDFGIGEPCQDQSGTGQYICDGENNVICEIHETPSNDIEVVTPTTELPAPQVNGEGGNNALIVNLPKIIASSFHGKYIDKNTKFKYVIHVRKLKRNGAKDKFFKLGKKVITYNKKNKIKFKNMDKGIYSVRYKVIIFKGNKEKSTKWSVRTLVEM